MIYFIIFFIILICALKYDFKQRQDTSNYVRFIFVILVCLAGFRYRVGTDTLVYMDEYEAGNMQFIKDKYLIGWYWLMKLFYSFHFSFYIVQFAIAIIINVGIFRFIKRNISYAFFSELLIYYSLVYPGWNFEVLRQAICVSLFLSALPFLEERKYIKYYAFISVACLFHETSLFLLFVPLLLKIKVSKFSLTVMVLLILVFIISAPFVREQVYTYALIMTVFKDKAEYYFDAVNLNESFNISNYLFNIVLNVGIPLFAIIRNMKTKRFSDHFIIISLLSLITYSLSTMLPMMYRLNYFFVLFSYVIMLAFIRDIAVSLSGNGNRRVFFVLLLLFILFKSRFYFIEKNDVPMYVHYYPYTDVFNKEIVMERELIDEY